MTATMSEAFMRIRRIGFLQFLFLFAWSVISCTEIELPLDIDDNSLTEILPSTVFEKECYRRLSQYVSFTWMPLSSVPFQGGSSFFPAHQEKKGMLYAEAAFQDKRVGYDVSLYTFVTAINNPYSLLYTENVNESNSHSAYGLQYHGDGNSGAYMGVACNSFVYMVLGSLISYSSYETSGIAEERGVVSRVNNPSSQVLKLMDILQTPGHVRIVSRLWSNQGRRIKKIEVTEAIGTGVRSVLYDAEEFDEWLRKTSYSIFRFNEHYSVGDVSPMADIDRSILSSISHFSSRGNDICTFAGDCASFGEDDIIIINYQKGSYSSMEVYCEDQLIDSIRLVEDSTVHNVDISRKGYGCGSFKARLVGDNVFSDFTFWEVLSIDLTADGNLIHCRCENATPLYWGLYDERGWACWKQQLDGSELETGIIRLPNPVSGYPYFKLYVQGKYGRIAKTFIR